jgi:hypothetical protein
LTYFVLEVNAALDTGKYDGISIQDVHERIVNKEVVPWLKSALGDDIDLSLFEGQAANELHDGLLDIHDGYRGQESRKWGVRQRGLCLLIAWAVELIQRQRKESAL